MPVIVVTRLRLKDPALLDEFFTAAVAAIEQAQKSAGNLGADALADASNAWWSVSAWQERQPMLAFVNSEPHLSISQRLDHFCDEATFVDWEQASPALPDWPTSWRRITADGQVTDLTQRQPRMGLAPFRRPSSGPAAGKAGPGQSCCSSACQYRLSVGRLKYTLYEAHGKSPPSS